MGTLNYTAGSYANDDNKNILGSRDRASGSHTTSTTAGDIASFTAEVGDVMDFYPSENMWVRFGGRPAAVGTGYFLVGSLVRQIEIGPGDEGTVSVIDEA